MNRKIKLIWDFHGEDAKGTADHHVIHLVEFMKKEAFELFDSGVDLIDSIHSIAFITVCEKDVITIRDLLKPQRATIIK